MPETIRILSLHSTAGSDVAVYKWPLTITESWNEAHEIAETVRWACSDFPELQTAMENCILSHFDPTSYDSMKLFCEKYNRAVDNIRKLWSGRQPPSCINAPPTTQHLKHIINQIYNRSITKPEELNQYEPFSPEVYGETSFDLINEVINVTRMNENDVFLDLGSGVGQVVLQVAAQVGCKCYGIEKAEIPAKYAEEMDRQFVKWMDFYGKSYGEYEILKGDFLDPKFNEIIYSATVVFCNNIAFGPSLNHNLKLKFQNLRDGVKIVSSREFCPLNFRITERKMTDIGAMMRVVQLSPLKGHVSWTGKPVTYYLHIIDRTLLEEFFLRQKNPGAIKSEGSSRSNTPFSRQDSSSSSSESSSEDSSLDSSNDEDLFSRHKQELYHFPPPTTTSSHFVPTNNSLNEQLLSEPHPLRRKSLATTSAVQKKSTPPSGSTHMPRPHPQVSQPIHRTKHGQGRRGRTRPQHQEKKIKKPKGLLIDLNALKVLFDSFQKQNEAYINQLDTPPFTSWLSDAVEKEKMKQRHLRGVIDHLESEVTSLSQDTIQTMQQSMLSLGITNLTPEGLLCGAKDIVSLNRQLRKEVQLLEKEVYQLKEQNNLMNSLTNDQQQNTREPPSQMTPPTLSRSNERSMETAPIGSSPEGSVSMETQETECAESTQLPSNIKKLTIEDSIEARSLLYSESNLSTYEINLETIDQAVLELGPFARDIDHQERLESIPLEWPVGNNEFLLKKDNRKRPYSPARVSHSNKLISEDFNIAESAKESKRKVSNGRRKTQKEGSYSPSWSLVEPTRPSSLESPLALVQSAPVENSAQLVSAPSPACAIKTPPSSHSLSQETAAVQAMLELSSGGHTLSIISCSNEMALPKETTPIREITTQLPPIPKTSKMEAIPGLPLSYSLPPGSSTTATNGPGSSDSSRRRTSSSSSHRSSVPVSDERSSALSPRSHATPPPGHELKAGVSRHLAPPSTVNPFWPVSIQSETSTHHTTSFPYYAASLYRPPGFYTPSLAYPTGGGTHVSIDSSTLDTPLLPPVVSPYFLRFPTPLQVNSFPPPGGTPYISTAPPTGLAFHATPISSTTVHSPLPPFKTLQGAAFNRSLTPPTHHPLGVAQTMDKNSVGETHLPNNWIHAPFINQYPSNAFLNSPQFTALGLSGATPPLHSFNFLNMAGLQAPPTVPMETEMSIREGKRQQRKRDSSSQPPPVADPLLPRQPHHDHGDPLRGHEGSKRPVVKSDLGRGVSKSERATPEKMKLKIHQLHNEDFKSSDKLSQQRKKRGRGQKLRAESTERVSTMSLGAINDRVIPSVTSQDDDIDVISVDTTPPHELNNKLHPLNEGDSPVIDSNQVNDEKLLDNNVSSEGTVSATPTPPGSPVPPLPTDDKSATNDNSTTITTDRGSNDKTITSPDITSHETNEEEKCRPVVCEFDNDKVVTRSCESSNEEEINESSRSVTQTDNNIDKSTFISSQDITTTCEPSNVTYGSEPNDKPVVVSSDVTTCEHDQPVTPTQEEDIDVTATPTPIEDTPTYPVSVTSSKLHQSISCESATPNLVIDEEAGLTPPTNKRLKLDSINEEDILTVNVEESLQSPLYDIRPNTELVPIATSSNTECITSSYGKMETVSSMNEIVTDTQSDSYHSTVPFDAVSTTSAVSSSHDDDISLSNEVSALISQDSNVTSSIDETRVSSKHLSDNKKPLNREFTHHNSTRGPSATTSHKSTTKVDDSHNKLYSSTVTSKHVKHRSTNSNVKKHHSTSYSDRDSKRYVKDRKHHHGDEHRHHPTHHSAHKRRHTPTDDWHHKRPVRSPPRSHHHHEGRGRHQRSHSSTPIRDGCDGGRGSDGGLSHSRRVQEGSPNRTPYECDSNYSERQKLAIVGDEKRSHSSTKQHHHYRTNRYTKE